MKAVAKYFFVIIATLGAISSWASPPSSTTQVGNTYYHSDGTTTTKVGNTYYHSDGSTSTEVGNTIYHSNGSSTSKVGNTYYNSDGSHSTQVGDTMYHSNGSHTSQVGNTQYHSTNAKPFKYNSLQNQRSSTNKNGTNTSSPTYSSSPGNGSFEVDVKVHKIKSQGSPSFEPVSKNLCPSKIGGQVKITVIGGLNEVTSGDKFIYSFEYNNETIMYESETGFINESFIVCKPTDKKIRFKVRGRDYNLIGDDVILSRTVDLKIVDQEIVTLELEDNLGEMVMRIDLSDDDNSDCVTCQGSTQVLPSITFGYLAPEDYLTYENLLADPSRKKIMTQSKTELIEVNSKIIGKGNMQPGGLIWPSNFTRGDGRHDIQSAHKHCQKKGARLPTIDEAYALCLILEGSRCTPSKNATKAKKLSSLNAGQRNNDLVFVTNSNSKNVYLYSIRFGNLYRLDDGSKWPATCVDDRYVR